MQKKHTNTSMSFKSEIENSQPKFGPSPFSHSSSLVDTHDHKYHHRSPGEEHKYKHRSDTSYRRHSHPIKNPYSQKSPSPPETSNALSLNIKSHSREQSFDEEHSTHQSPIHSKQEHRSHPSSPSQSQIRSISITPSRSTISPLTHSSQLSNVHTCELPSAFTKPHEIKRIQNVPLEKDMAHLILYSYTFRSKYGIRLNGNFRKKMKKFNIDILASFLKESLLSNQPQKTVPSSLLKEMGLEDSLNPSKVPNSSVAKIEKSPGSCKYDETAELPKISHSESELAINNVSIKLEPLIKKEKLESCKAAEIPKESNLDDQEKDPLTLHNFNEGNENKKIWTVDKEIKKEPCKDRNNSGFEKVHNVIKKEKSKKKKHKSNIKEEAVKNESQSPNIKPPKTIHHELADIKDPRLKRSPPYFSRCDHTDFEYLSCKFKRDEKHISFGPKVKKSKSHDKKR